jgi:hypothetical protein
VVSTGGEPVSADEPARRERGMVLVGKVDDHVLEFGREALHASDEGLVQGCRNAAGFILQILTRA